MKSQTQLNRAASELGKRSWRVRLKRHGIDELRRIAKQNFERRRLGARPEAVCSKA